MDFFYLFKVYYHASNVLTYWDCVFITLCMHAYNITLSTWGTFKVPASSMCYQNFSLFISLCKLCFFLLNCILSEANKFFF